MRFSIIDTFQVFFIWRIVLDNRRQPRSHVESKAQIDVNAENNIYTFEKGAPCN